MDKSLHFLIHFLVFDEHSSMRLSNLDGLGALNLYHNLFYFAKRRFVLQESGDFSWRMSECDE